MFDSSLEDAAQAFFDRQQLSSVFDEPEKTRLLASMLKFANNLQLKADFFETHEAVLLLTAADLSLMYVHLQSAPDLMGDGQLEDAYQNLPHLIQDLVTQIEAFQTLKPTVKNLTTYVQALEQILVLVSVLTVFPERLMGFHTYCMLMRKSIWTMKSNQDVNTLPLAEKRLLFGVTPQDDHWSVFYERLGTRVEKNQAVPTSLAVL